MEHINRILKLNTLAIFISSVLFLGNNLSSQAQNGIACNTAINISTLPLNYFGTTCGSINNYTLTSSNPNNCATNQNSYTNGEDIIFTFTPTTTGDFYFQSVGVSAGTAIHIFESCPTSPLNSDCYSFSVNATAGGSNDFTANFTANITYYIMIESAGASCTDFFFFMYEGNNSAVPNDFCADALPLTGAASNFGATAIGEPNGWTPGFGACPGGIWTANQNGVWFTFEVSPSTPQPVTIEILNVICDSAGPLQMGIWSNTGTCDLGNESFYGCSVGTGTLSITATLPVGSYYLFTDGSFGAECVWNFESDEVLCSLEPEVSNPPSICTGESFQSLQAVASVPGNDLTWYDANPEGPFANELFTGAILNAPSYFNNNNAGTYSVFLVESDGVCFGDPIEIVQNVLPSVDEVNINEVGDICVGQSMPVILSASTSDLINGLAWYDANPEEGPATQIGVGFTVSTPPYFDNTTAGSYSVWVIESNLGCESPPTPLTINVTNPPSAIVVAPIPDICITPPIVLTAFPEEGDNEINWYDGLPGLPTTSVFATGTEIPFPDFINPTINGLHSVWVQEVAPGCDGIPLEVMINVITPSPPTVENLESICVGETLPAQFFAFQNGVDENILWYDDDPSTGTAGLLELGNVISPPAYFDNMTAGEYSVWIEASTGDCVSTPVQLTLTVIGASTPNPDSVTAICAGDALPTMLTVTPESTETTVVWYDSNPEVGTATEIGIGNSISPPAYFNNNVAGDYIVWVIEEGGNCASAAISLSLTVEATPDAPMPTVVEDICVDAALPTSLTATPNTVGNTITWYDTNPETPIGVVELGTGNSLNTPDYFDNGTIGDYTVWLTESDDNNCVSTAVSLTLTVNNFLNMPVPDAITGICEGQALPNSLTATPSTAGNELNWYDTDPATGTATLVGTGASISSPTYFDNTTAGNYMIWLTETSGAGCEGPAVSANLTVSTFTDTPTPVATLPVCEEQNLPALLEGTPSTTGNTLNWYDEDPAGGTATLLGSGLTIAPPDYFDVNTAGIYTIWITEATTEGCEGGAVSLTLEVITCNCPASDFGTPAIDYLCSGDAPVLPVEGTDFTITDADDTQIGVLEWYDGSNPSTASSYNPMAVNHSGADNCVADAIVTVYAFVQCDFDTDGTPDNFIQVASHQFQVFPDPQAPTISQDDLTCSYTITTACDDDVVAPNSFGPLAPGADAGTVTLTINSGLANNPCASADFEVAYDACPAADCPSSDFTTPDLEALCSGETPTLPVEGTDFTITDDGNAQLGGVQWFVGNDPAVDAAYTPTATNHSGADNCAADAVETVFAFVECDTDLDGSGDLWIAVAQHQFQVYPEPQAPSIVQNDETCSYTIIAACADDVLDPATFANLAPGTPSGTTPITVTTVNGCTVAAFDVAYAACPALNLPCPTSDFTIPTAQYLCDGETPVLPVEDVDFTITDVNGSQLGGVEWFTGTDLAVAEPYVLAALNHSGDDLCQADALVTVYAFVQCDVDLDGTSNDWVQVASHQFQVFPEVQSPTLLQIPNTCSFTIAPACSMDMLTPNNFGPLNPGDIGGDLAVNATSGIPNSPCSSADFDLTYGACPLLECPTTNFTAPVTEALCSGDVPTLPMLGIDFTINDPDGAQLGTMQWFDANDVPYIPTSVLHSGGDLCSPDAVITITGFVGCDTNADGIEDDLIEVATHQFQAYPEPQAPMITQLDATCNYQIEPFCASDVLDPNETISQVPGTPAGLTMISVNSGIANSPCTAVGFEVPYVACPLGDCPSSDFLIGEIEAFCDGDMPNLPQNGVDFNINDPSTTQTGEVQWFDGENPDTATPYTANPIAHSGADVCGADAPQMVFAFVGCDNNSDGERDFWIPVASHQFQVYPEPQMPSIVRLNDTCTYEIIPVCPEDVVSPSDIGVLPPNTVANTVALTVNTVSGVCPAMTFEVAHDACPALENQLALITSFSPNGDNINDVFRVIGVNISGYELAIYNRWGEEVFRNTEATTEVEWDGTQNGELCGIGAYVYYGTVYFADGTQKPIRGNVMLIR